MSDRLQQTIELADQEKHTAQAAVAESAAGIHATTVALKGARDAADKVIKAVADFFVARNNTANQMSANLSGVDATADVYRPKFKAYRWRLRWLGIVAWWRRYRFRLLVVLVVVMLITAVYLADGVSLIMPTPAVPSEGPS